MKRILKQFVLLMLAASLLTGSVGCGQTPPASEPTEPTVSTEPSTPPETVVPTEPAGTVPVTWAAYDASQDAQFLPKDIFFHELYAPGVLLGQSDQYSLDITAQSDAGAFVLQGEYGKCYEVKVPAGTSRVRAARFPTDPRTLAAGTQVSYTSTTSLVDSANTAGGVSFMYTCRTSGEYLVVDTGSADPIYIGQRSIIAEADTPGPWYTPEPVGGIIHEKALGDIRWSADEVIDHLYEPVRARYPDYITRTAIGKDATGTYDMYCYVYTPQDYKTTMFLSGGMHGSEVVGYFALAKTLQLIADATPEDTLLYTLRQNVRFVVIPIVNVWGATCGRVRANGNGQDLNRDFGNVTQQETKNVLACFARYAEDVSILMDFHIAAGTSPDVALYFNFINYTDNAVANYKATNHMYHRYLELGCAEKDTDLSKVPGSYTKNSKYLEGRIWNQYRIPTITVEYITTKKFPSVYSDECMTLAVETYSNFIIQNALFFLQDS